MYQIGGLTMMNVTFYEWQNFREMFHSSLGANHFDLNYMFPALRNQSEGLWLPYQPYTSFI